MVNTQSIGEILDSFRQISEKCVAADGK